MSAFEYLAVLISIVIGLAITHILGGIARIISHPSRYRVYWLHLLWTAYVFLYLVYFWWFSFWMNRVEVWTPLLFSFLILYAVISYVICAVLIPADFPEDGDFRQYFFSRRRWFFGLLLAQVFIDAVDSSIKEHEISSPLGFLISGGLLVPAMVTKNPKFHAALAILLTTLLVLSLIQGNWGPWTGN